ncbi:MAG: DUF3105 domain-containing protein [Myxococcales bacterium]|nr:DUF3105 domain-containing protein [Myxococcales bacterium]
MVEPPAMAFRTLLVGIAGAAACALGACGDNLHERADDLDAAGADATVIDGAAIDATAGDATDDGPAPDAPGDLDGGNLDGGDLDAPDGGDLDGGDLDGGGPDGGDLDGGAPDGPTCTTSIASAALAPGIHVAQCTPITYATNPPTSGPHYPLWARFKAYADRVPRGFWVHSMEHGAVVVTYNCPAGCAAELAALDAFLAARPADPLCVPPLRNRFIVTPDPLLDTTFAASAWGWSLRSDCFDLPALGAFIDAHYGQAPEDFCSDGFDPTAPGSGVPADCP